LKGTRTKMRNPYQRPIYFSKRLKHEI